MRLVRCAFNIWTQRGSYYVTLSMSRDWVLIIQKTDLPKYAEKLKWVAHQFL